MSYFEQKIILKLEVERQRLDDLKFIREEKKRLTKEKKRIEADKTLY